VLGTHENPEQFFPLAAALGVLENHDGENEVRGEKAHQGFFAEKRALHRGITWSNSTTALGSRRVGLEIAVGRVVPAKNATPNPDWPTLEPAISGRAWAGL
jgi:hypothetical protein